MTYEKRDPEDDEMRPEYDFTGAVRGKYADAFRRGHRVIIHYPDGTTEEQVYPGEEGVVILDSDVRQRFPDSESVNKALRSLIDLIPQKT